MQWRHLRAALSLITTVIHRNRTPYRPHGATQLHKDNQSIHTRSDGSPQQKCQNFWNLGFIRTFILQVHWSPWKKVGRSMHLWYAWHLWKKAFTVVQYRLISCYESKFVFFACIFKNNITKDLSCISLISLR